MYPDACTLLPVPWFMYPDSYTLGITQNPKPLLLCVVCDELVPHPPGWLDALITLNPKPLLLCVVCDELVPHPPGWLDAFMTPNPKPLLLCVACNQVPLPPGWLDAFVREATSCIGAFKEREASMLLSALCEYDVPPPLPGSVSAPSLLSLAERVEQRFVHNEQVAARVAQLRDIAVGFGV